MRNFMIILHNNNNIKKKKNYATDMFLMKRKYRLELDHKHARVIVDDQTAFLDRYTRTYKA